MTREEAKELLPIIQAFAEGKAIQYKTKYVDWIETDCPTWVKQSQYRIKPEPKYRPFKSQEECWNEMLKHQPFAFLSSANEYDWFSICRVFEEEGIPKITFASNPYSDYDMTKVFDTFQFADGTPFGIKEEE